MMKNLVIVSILMAGAFAQAGNQQFQCVNNMFRQARFDVLNQEILIQDSFVNGMNELEVVLAEALNQDQISIHQLALQVHKKESVCSTDFAPLVNCATQSERAALIIRGYLNGSALSGSLNLSLDVKLNKLEINSHLASEGSIDLGDTPTVITVNRVNLEATAEVVVNGKIVELNFKPFFLNGQSSPNSFCKVL